MRHNCGLLCFAIHLSVIANESNCTHPACLALSPLFSHTLSACSPQFETSLLRTSAELPRAVTSSIITFRSNSHTWSMKGVERKVLEEGKDGEIPSKGDKVIVDLIGNSYDEAKGEEAYYRGKE